MSQPTSKLSRRTLFGAASTAGAVAAVASLIPTVIAEPPSAVAALKPAPEKGGGYSLSDHVKQYYRTTRV